ncbi:hypothetical protein P4S93_17530 [Aneurinibacillus thermoaerophilus]|uniref:D-glucuronyl C5-epimerase C-terminal domain-containing protein n=1 Tax=Aneurinibacillus thermoaerophilus TaxID=143495 RepID=A0A1G8D046_ANETH|nr:MULTISPECIES: hypothetical protein [Aneurinibacillus]AMA72266.1 hypothetical protein ACH33_04965 [Aneurinibacillus sp. XH2]MED0758462.1 hypothetical protein [Aneurinibacillus thermoaerophilus]MED0762537.1 hypothetical protein [Aneurinibacillus thermoaerophilus]QYY41975.1 hypothetical protein K3F53_13935 [Aneurinibacillus thermoaerophilus]SDH50783.1 hypothetical protein SAMN04489735_102922 [Aneurinibacillus thermoaerophilus]
MIDFGKVLSERRQMKTMIARWFGLLLSLCLFIALATQVSAKEASMAFFPIDLDKDGIPEFRIEASGWVADVTPSVTTDTYEHAVYTHYQYKKGGLSFRLTLARMENGSVLYFVQHTASDRAVSIPLRILAFDPTVVKTAQLSAVPTKTWKQSSYIPPVFSSALYVDGERLFYRIGQAEAYAPLGYTVYKQIREKEQPIKHAQAANGHTFSLVLNADAKTEAVTWGMLGNQPLIRWDNEQAAAKAALLELDKDKKLREDGAYYPNESTYRPYAPGSFYRNPANGDGLHALSFLSTEENGAFFVNLATHLAYAAVKNQNKEGYWETQPRSEWLNKEYKIGYKYMDNRRNADNATFLLRFTQAMPDAAVQHALRKWNAYLTRYIAMHGMKIGKYGVFVPDYVGSAETKRTHTSLNHLVAIMNYLYEAYLRDQDEEKRELGNKLLAGIKATQELWVMPNHNLYYALYPNFTPHPYPDYLDLTRNDLLLSQYFLTRIQGEPDPVLQYLIDNKNKWLDSQQ